MKLTVTRVRKQATLPCRATPGSAGLDLYACLSAPVRIIPGGLARIPTGIAIALPGNEYAAFIYARSGLGTKHGIVPGNCVGVIDSDYRGELIVGLHNHGTESFVIHPGDRIAQMVVAPVIPCEPVECDELDQTQRGARGFGSSGR